MLLVHSFESQSNMQAKRIAVVAAPYHTAVGVMIEIVRSRFGKRYPGVEIVVFEVPGAFEIPFEVSRCLADGFDAAITLGAIELGETGHGEAIANAVFPYLISLSLQHGKPVSLGIIGPKATIPQIESRSITVATDAAIAIERSLGLSKDTDPS